MTSQQQTNIKCKGCAVKGGIYYFKCNECKTRFLLNEPCKKYRAVWAERISNKWGDVGDWKREPSCGCQGECKRLKAIRNVKRIEVDSTFSPKRKSLPFKTPFWSDKD